MPIIKIAPDYTVNTDNILDVKRILWSDKYDKPHVLINFHTFGHCLDPEYTYEEIMAALDGRCYYRKEWTDEVGSIDVCVIHGQNSQFDLARSGPFRACLELEPWCERSPYSLYGFPTKPDVSQSWEFREKERQVEQEKERARELLADELPQPTLSPVAEYLASGVDDRVVDMTFDNTHYEPPRRPWWKRIFGIN